MTTTAHASSIQVDGHSLKTANAEKAVVVDGSSTATVAVACPTGYVATSGGFLADSVDDGDLAAVFVTTSDQTSGAGGWTVTVRNDNDGRAQGKVKVSCLATATEPAKDKHTHAVQYGTTVSASHWIAAESSMTIPLACPAAGDVPVRPRFTSSGAVLLTQARAEGGKFHFTFEAVEASTVIVYVDCLKTALTPIGSDAPELAITEVTEEFSAGSGVSEANVVCPAGAVSLLSSFAFTDSGVTYLGGDPRGSQRMMRFLNDLDDAASVSVGATCLRSERSARTITVGNALTTTQGSKVASVPITCTFKCTVTVKLFAESGGKAVAVGKAVLPKGVPTDVKLRARESIGAGDYVVKAAAGSVRATRNFTIS